MGLRDRIDAFNRRSIRMYEPEAPLAQLDRAGSDEAVITGICRSGYWNDGERTQNWVRLEGPAGTAPVTLEIGGRGMHALRLGFTVPVGRDDRGRIVIDEQRLRSVFPAARISGSPRGAMISRGIGDDSDHDLRSPEALEKLQQRTAMVTGTDASTMLGGLAWHCSVNLTIDGVPVSRSRTVPYYASGLVRPGLSIPVGVKDDPDKLYVDWLTIALLHAPAGGRWFELPADTPAYALLSR